MTTNTTPERMPGAPTPNASGLVARVKALLLTPKTEWPAIEAEQAGIADLFSRYAVLLALLPAAVSFVRNAFIGVSALGFSVTRGIGPALALALGQYLVTLLAVALIAFVIALLAPLFGGIGTRRSAFRLAIYSSTASWVAALLTLVPSLAFLGLLGLYSIYLLYTGLPVTMKVPPEKAGPMTATVAVAAIILSFLMSSVMLPVSGLLAGLMADTGAAITGHEDSATLTLPNGDTVDTGKLREASEKLKDMGKNGSPKPVAPAHLKALLPETIAGYRRGSVESESIGAAGIGGAQASATYAAGDRRLTIEITDMGAAGALTGLGAALNVHREKESHDGFERTRVEQSGIVKEEWAESTHSGRYAHSVGGRFMVSVIGEADRFATLKAIGDGIDAARLEALAK